MTYDRATTGDRAPRRIEAFETDIVAMRAHARAHLDDGAITDDYTLDPTEVVRMLDIALATEVVCALRYKRHYYIADGVRAKVVADEFLEHAREEEKHADALAKRIVELGGAPDLNPSTLAVRSHAEYSNSSDLDTMIDENLVAERVAIESYRAMIRWLGDRDPTTRRVLEEILAAEEEHADDLRSLRRSRGRTPTNA